MSTSPIPPPIVNSRYFPASSASLDQPSLPTDHDLLLFRTKQRQLEAQLQLLLDAQADGLLSALDLPPSSVADEDAQSTGSSTPTATDRHARPIQSAKPPKPALRDARLGLYATIRRLAQLKAQESQYLTPTLDHFASIVAQLDTWDKKRQALQTKTSHVRSGTDQQRAYDLHKQADDMQNDISDLEEKLARLKAHQHTLRAQAQEIENTVDARVTSYTTSLTLLNDHVRDFLAHDSLDQWPAIMTASDMNRFWKMPRENRTLETARDLFSRERDSLLQRRQANDAERDALEEGAVVWKDTVKQVSAFESKLAKAMSHMNKHSTPRSTSPSDAFATTKDLLSLLEENTIELEERHKLAETRNWKLLVCAIGAELEAFLKGKQILEAALASTDDRTDLDQANDRANGSGSLEGAQTPRGSRHDDSEAISNLDKAFAAKAAVSSASDTDTEDDGPDPELLISHQDTDTE